jgi:tRNA A-37 threonylcarbamoyl transferase component Bud32
MGVVYLALAQGPAGFQKLKVIKRLRADLAADEKALEMFLDEARLAARLQHPNIVQTNEVGFDGKHYFLEMEYLEGQSYDALIRHAKKAGGVPLEVSCWILSEVLAGLQHAHELVDLGGKRLEIVHRDVSPHNVMVTYDGTVKLLDFGIAKAADSQSETQTGVVKGKVTYMAPEQATRKPVDRRADLFAVGVMLWQALTGQRLWGDANDFEIFIKLGQGDPIPSARSVNPDAPEELDAVATRALSFDREARFGSAAEMRAALDKWLAGREKANGRAAAALMEEIFSVQRKAVRAEIEAQIKQPMMGMTAADVPVLGEGQATRSGTGTGNAEVGQAGVTQVPTSVRQRTEIKGLRTIAIGAIAVALVASGAAVLSGRARRQGGNVAVNADAAAVRPAGWCTTNKGCTEKNGGKASVCNQGSGACVVLEEAGCKILAEPGEVESEKTIWIGAMFPLTGPRANHGIEAMRAVDLGRRDFAQIAKGISRASGTQPLAVLSCDDADGGEASARHLVAAGVPAVIGFSLSQEVIDLANEIFLPAHVMMVPAHNASPLITKILQPKGEPRLIFRTSASSVQQIVPLALLVSQELEPSLRARGLADNDTIRIAFARPKTTIGLGFEDAIFGTLKFNKKSVLENGKAFRGIPIPDPTTNPVTQDYASAVDSVLEMRPHIVIYLGEDEVTGAFIEPIEARWPKGEPLRPFYLSPNSFGGNPKLLGWLAKQPDLRRRFFHAAVPASSPANVRFTGRYNETFPEKVTEDLSPAPPYDALYLVAYALAATDELSGGGPAVARSIARLVPPGTPIEIGPSQILDAFAVLQKGGNLDLTGAGSPLDFDLATGESLLNYTIECIGTGAPGGPAVVADTGLTFSASTKQLTGVRRCP